MSGEGGRDWLMMSETACAATFETVWVIATCLEAPGHSGPHWDYGNRLQWTTTATLVPTPDDAGGKG